MKQVKIIDTTLRDGMHSVSHQYTLEQMEKIATALNKSGVYAVEVSHGDGLGGSSIQYGFSRHTDEQYLNAVSKVLNRAKLAILLLPGIGTKEDLTMAKKANVSVARVATHVTEADISRDHHFWFYVYQAMANGRGVAMLGNYAHETFLCRYDRKAKGFVGRSYQDYALGEMGVRLGSSLRNGDMGIGDAGNWIQTMLSSGGRGADYWNGSHLGAEFEKRFYALSLAIVGATLFPIGEGQQGR